MWEDILKIRSYSLAGDDGNKMNGSQAFEAISNIRNDLRRMCNKLGLGFKENRPNVYDSELDSDYYSMLERLNSVIYAMARKRGLKDLKRSSRRLRGRVYFDRRADVSSRAFIGNQKGLKIILATRRGGRGEDGVLSSSSVFMLNITAYFPQEINSTELKEIKEEFRTYFTNNFDNGNLDVESLVDNIFNNLQLTIVEQEPEEELEGTIREKWWE